MPVSKENVQIMNLIYSILLSKLVTMDEIKTKQLQEQIASTKEEGPRKALEKELAEFVESSSNRIEELDKTMLPLLGGKESYENLGVVDLEEQGDLFKEIKEKLQNAIDYKGEFDASVDPASRLKSYEALLQDVLRITNASEKFKFDDETNQALASLIQQVQKNEESASSIQDQGQKELNKIVKLLVDNVMVTLQEFMKVQMIERDKNTNQPWRKDFVQLTVAIEDMVKQEVHIIYVKMEIREFSEKKGIINSVEASIDELQDSRGIVVLLGVVNDACASNHELNESKRLEREMQEQQRKEFSIGGMNGKINKALTDAESLAKKCTNKLLANLFKRDNLVKVYKEMMRACILQGEDFEALNLGKNPDESQLKPGAEQNAFIDEKVKAFFGQHLTSEKITNSDMTLLIRQMKAINKSRANCDNASTISLSVDDNSSHLRTVGYGFLAIGLIGAAFYYKEPIKNFGYGAFTSTKSMTMSYGSQGVSWFGKAMGSAFTMAFAAIVSKPIVNLSTSLQGSITTFFAKPKALPQTPSMIEQVEESQKLDK